MTSKSRLRKAMEFRIVGANTYEPLRRDDLSNRRRYRTRPFRVRGIRHRLFADFRIRCRQRPNLSVSTPMAFSIVRANTFANFYVTGSPDVDDSGILGIDATQIVGTIANDLYNLRRQHRRPFGPEEFHTNIRIPYRWYSNLGNRHRWRFYR